MLSTEDKYILSCYDNLSELGSSKENGKITLVKHNISNKLFVKKFRSKNSLEIYNRLKKANLSSCPKIEHILTDDDKIIVIEEFINGVTLDNYIGKDGLMELSLSFVISGVINGLRQLHEMTPPLIHRDIKPSNIMVFGDKISFIDLDSVREYDGNKKDDTYYMGTPVYAAPEQYGFGESDERTDIYSLGILINLLLTGKYPNEKMPQGPVKRVISKCLEVKKEDRYNNLHELEVDLFSYNLVESVSAKKNPFLSFFFGYSSTRKYLPVGFRKGKILNMLIALVGYGYLIWANFVTVFLTEKYYSDSSPVSMVYFDIFILGTIIWWGDYLSIRSSFIDRIDDKPNPKKSHRIILAILVYIPFFILFNSILSALQTVR